MLGMTPNALTRLEKAERGELAEIDRDLMWTDIAEAVDEQIGKLLSVREEFSRKFADDRKKRLLRRIATRGR
jgi:hypothetical protein